MRTFGWRRDLPDHRDWKYTLHPEYTATPPLPAKVDLRSQMSPIEDQGRLGSCVAHATCGALEFLEIQAIKQNIVCPEDFGSAFQRLSRLFVYFNARAMDGDTNRDAGTQLRTAAQAIQNAGICREVLWPYDPEQVFKVPTQPAYVEGEKHKVLFTYRIDNTDIYDLKQCLANGYPFVYGMSVYESMMSGAVAQSGIVPIPGPGEELLGGHAQCCVGYDESAGCWIVRNSWGADWGMAGYCYIPFAYLTNPDLAADFWTFRKTGPVSLHRGDFQVGGGRE